MGVTNYLLSGMILQAGNQFLCLFLALQAAGFTSWICRLGSSGKLKTQKQEKTQVLV